MVVSSVFMELYWYWRLTFRGASPIRSNIPICASFCFYHLDSFTISIINGGTTYRNAHLPLFRRKMPDCTHIKSIEENLFLWLRTVRSIAVCCNTVTSSIFGHGVSTVERYWSSTRGGFFFEYLSPVGRERSVYMSIPVHVLYGRSFFFHVKSKVCITPSSSEPIIIAAGFFLSCI